MVGIQVARPAKVYIQQLIIPTRGNISFPVPSFGPSHLAAATTHPRTSLVRGGEGQRVVGKSTTIQDSLFAGFSIRTLPSLGLLLFIVRSGHPQTGRSAPATQQLWLSQSSDSSYTRSATLNNLQTAPHCWSCTPRNPQSTFP